MKQLLSIIVKINFFIFLNSYSQNKNTEVIYKFMLVNDTVVSSKKADFIKNKESEISKIANTLKPKLIFNDSIASFYCSDELSKGDEFLYNLAKIYCNCSSPIIYSKKDDKLYYNFPEGTPFLDQDYTVYKKLTRKWKLTKETKKNDNYTCYKATVIDEEPRSKGEIALKKVIAWYCPELPFSFGPSGYGGLPGLILELQVDDVFYGMVSIKIKSSDAKIETIKKYDLKSEADYFKLVDEVMAKFKN